MEIYGKGHMFIPKVFILCLIFHSLLLESSADLETLIVEDLYKYNSSVNLDLQFYKSSILKSQTNKPLDCEIKLHTLPQNSVVISFRRYNLETDDTLVFQDFDGTQLSVANFGDFKFEEKSFLFSSPLTIHFKTDKNGWFMPKIKFKLVFTEVHGYPCSEKEFQCSNGICIQNDFVCDKHNQCGDLSDETDCNRFCRSTEFRCGNSKCIPDYNVCDGVNNCGDMSDETDCLRTCSSEEFKCSNDKCIPITDVCDGHNDCGDMSDEEDCNHACRSDEFQCSNQKCISGGQVCNGINNCGDQSDEKDCYRRCRSSEFRCSNSKCIPDFFVCDKYNDCGDMSDEKNCLKVKVEETKKEVSILTNPWFIAITVCGGILAILVIIAAVSVRVCFDRRKKEYDNEHSAATVTSPEQPMAPPTFFGRIRQSFRSVRPSAPAAVETISGQPPEACEVPSMYPELPPPYSGVDNADFSADE